MLEKEDISIRNLQEKDIGHIIALLKKTGLFFKSVDTQKTYEQMIKYNPRSVLVMEYGEKIIGMAFIVYSPLLSAIYHLCIDPLYQKQGLGSLMMLEAEKIINELGGTADIAGYIEEDNIASLAMCKKAGYRIYPKRIVCVCKISDSPAEENK